MFQQHIGFKIMIKPLIVIIIIFININLSEANENENSGGVSWTFMIVYVSIAGLFVSCVCTYWCYKICIRCCNELCIPIEPKVPDIVPSYESRLSSRASASVKNKPYEPPPDYPGASTVHINLHQNIQNQNNYDSESAHRPKVSLSQKKVFSKTNSNEKNDRNLSPSHLLYSLSPLPPTPSSNLGNSSGEWINGSWVSNLSTLV